MLSRRLRSIVLAAIFMLPATAFAQLQVNQTFNEQGPAPSTGPFCVIGTGDAPAPAGGFVCPPGKGQVGPGQNRLLYGTIVGAVQAVVPVDANTIYVGAVNGGVWVTHNGGTSWTPLTDNQASLSITSLAIDPKNSAVLLAGTGQMLNGNLNGTNPRTTLETSGGPSVGLLYSKDGGDTWALVGQGTITNSVVADAVRGNGNILLAGTYEMSAFATSTFAGGLYVSTNGGSTFNLVNNVTDPNSHLPPGPVTSIVGNTGQSNVLYAAITADNANDLKQTAIYVSRDTGATWKPIFTATNCNGCINSTDQTVIKLATGPNNTIAAAVVDLTTQKLSALYYSTNDGPWINLGLPSNGQPLNPEKAAPRNLAIAIDPTNPQYVYVSGDDNNNGTTYTTPVYRINADASVIAWTNLNDSGTANGSAVHADSRSLAFLPNGNLILTGDGGVYVRTQPESNTGVWQGLNGAGLSTFNTYAIGYDAVGNRLIAAAQDGGVSIQSARNSNTWNNVVGSDGTAAFVNDVTLKGLGYSVFYGTAANLSTPTRIIMNQQGNIISPNTAVYDIGTNVTCNGGQNCSGVVSGYYFSSPWINNRSDPTLMAMGGDHVYVTQDTLTGNNGLNAKTVDLMLTDLGSVGSGAQVTTMAYIASTLVAGVLSNNGQLWISTNATPTAGLTPPPGGSMQQLRAYTGLAPNSIVFDPRNNLQNFYVADSQNVYATSNQGGSFIPLLLPAGFTRPTATEFISNNGVNALLVGGLNTPLTCTSAPNGCVISPTQSPIVIADSDATGNLSSFRMFGQRLPNAQVGQLAYNPAVDVLAVGTFGRGVFTLYDVTSYFPQATVLQFGLADNDSMPDASYLTDGKTLDGTTFSRPLMKDGTGTLTITGTATYSGSTTVNGGTLEVDGTLSNTSSVAVNSTGTLTGVGTVDPLVVTINAGGTFAPGAAGVPGTSMNIVGNLAFQSGAYYLVQLDAKTSTFANVTGTASLGGTVEAVFLPGTIPAHQYTILQSAGLNGTAFGSLVTVNLPNFSGASLSYTADDVLLNNFTATLGAGGGLNGNQQNVANALNNFYNSGGTLPPNFAAVFGLSGPSLANVLTQLSGEVATDAERGAFQLMTEFLGLMLDPFVDGRLGSGNGQAMGFAPDEQASLPPDIALAYASILKKAPPQPTFDQRWTARGRRLWRQQQREWKCDRRLQQRHCEHLRFRRRDGLSCHAEYRPGLRARRRRLELGPVHRGHRTQRRLSGRRVWHNPRGASLPGRRARLDQSLVHDQPLRAWRSTHRELRRTELWRAS
jgi:autotransporter-associated beta strand protein